VFQILNGGQGGRVWIYGVGWSGLGHLGHFGGNNNFLGFAYSRKIVGRCVGTG
jgi:hypothetical protein